MSLQKFLSQPGFADARVGLNDDATERTFRDSAIYDLKIGALAVASNKSRLHAGGYLRMLCAIGGCVQTWPAVEQGGSVNSDIMRVISFK